MSKLGLVAGAIGFVLMMIAFIIFMLGLVGASAANIGFGVFALLVMIAYSVLIWLISNIFYIASFVLTRKHGSRFIGVISIIAGILHVIALVTILQVNPSFDIGAILLLVSLAYFFFGIKWFKKAVTH